MKKFLTKENIEIIILAIISTIILVVLVFLAIEGNSAEKNTYNKCLNNPPTIRYVEKDLEDDLITTNVEVLKIEQKEDICYYIVKANGLYFKVVYCISDKCDEFPGIKEWKFSRCIQISESEVNEQISQ